MKEITLDLLRMRINECKLRMEYLERTSKIYDTESVQSYNDAMSELFTYQDLIKYMRDMKEREFRLAIKKGTL